MAKPKRTMAKQPVITNQEPLVGSEHGDDSITVRPGNPELVTRLKPSEEYKATEITMPKFKEDVNAFNTTIEDGRDYISAMPSEVLNEIISYLARDHDPERAVKEHSSDPKISVSPHALLSLSAMSRDFRDHVESFCHRELERNKSLYYFRSNDELEDEKGPRRRSERLKGKPVTDTRCYRRELVTKLSWRCIGCNDFTGRSAVMANGLGCCVRCYPAYERGTIVS